MNKTHYIYKVTDPNTNEFYIGVRSCIGASEDDIKYKGSMNAWKVDKTILIKEIILELPTRDEANQKEIEYITFYKKHFKDKHLCKNAHIPNKGFCMEGAKLTDETKKKMSEYMIKNNIKPPSNLGSKHSNKTKNKMSEAKKNINLSEEHKQKLKDAWKNRKPMSDKTKLKMSESKKGKIVSEETKLKISENNKGKTKSEETKLKMKLAALKREEIKRKKK